MLLLSAWAHMFRTKLDLFQWSSSASLEGITSSKVVRYHIFCLMSFSQLRCCSRIEWLVFANLAKCALGDVVSKAHWWSLKYTVPTSLRNANCELALSVSAREPGTHVPVMNEAVLVKVLHKGCFTNLPEKGYLITSCCYIQGLKDLVVMWQLSTLALGYL